MKRLIILIVMLGYIGLAWIKPTYVSQIVDFTSSVNSIISDGVTIDGGNSFMIVDATGNDSSIIYDDGDTTRFESDNPIKIGSGSIVIDDSVTINCFTMFGNDAPKIKIKRLTGTSSATEGSDTTITHGLDKSKIIGAQVLINNASGNRIPPGFIGVNEFQYSFFIDGTYLRVYLHSSNSSSITSRLITILIIYEE